MGGLANQPDSEYSSLGVDRARKNFDRIGSAEVKRLELFLRGPPSRKHSSRPLFQPHCGQFDRQRQGGEGPRRDGVHRSKRRGVHGLDAQGMNLAAAPVARAASRKKAHLRWSLSMQ